MLYSAGNTTVTLEQIRSTYRVPTRSDLKTHLGDNARENSGIHWQPTHHADLIDELHRGVTEQGLTVTQEQFVLSEDTHSLFGYMQFEGYDTELEDIAPVLGFRQDNLQRFKLIGVTGAKVGICANGMILGDFVFGYKLTKANANRMDANIDAGIRKWRHQATKFSRFISFMNAHTLSEAAADNLLLTAMRQKVIAPSQIGKIDAIYHAYLDPEHPHHEAFAERTPWSLYNAVTENSKTSTSIRVVERELKGFPRVITDTLHFDELDALVVE